MIGKNGRATYYNQYSDGSDLKVALLSGPPGVGKTTTANIVAKELGFDIVEFNASDTRNKNLLVNQVSELIGSQSLAQYAIGNNYNLLNTACFQNIRNNLILKISLHFRW